MTEGMLEKPAEILDISIVNLLLAVANKEYPFTIPEECKMLKLQSRDGTAVRVATKQGVVNDSSPPFWTMKAAVASGENSQALDLSGLNFKKQKLIYFATAGTNIVVEILIGV